MREKESLQDAVRPDQAVLGSQPQIRADRNHVVIHVSLVLHAHRRPAGAPVPRSCAAAHGGGARSLPAGQERLCRAWHWQLGAQPRK